MQGWPEGARALAKMHGDAPAHFATAFRPVAFARWRPENLDDEGT
jgi:hypothetical protein